jgi:hypothetical protein
MEKGDCVRDGLETTIMILEDYDDELPIIGF